MLNRFILGLGAGLGIQLLWWTSATFFYSNFGTDEAFILNGYGVLVLLLSSLFFIKKRFIEGAGVLISLLAAILIVILIIFLGCVIAGGCI